MALPARTSVETLDYPLGAQPTAVLEAKSLSSGTLDYSLGAQPVAGLPPGASAQTVTQTSRFDNTNAFYGGTVSVGAVAVTQTSRFDNTNAFYGGALTQTQPVAQTSRFDNTNAFYGGTISVGAVAVTQTSRFDNTNAFYGGTVGTVSGPQKYYIRQPNQPPPEEPRGAFAIAPAARGANNIGEQPRAALAVTTNPRARFSGLAPAQRQPYPER